MIFEWDETKRLVNLRKHGADFRDVYRVFAGPTLSIEDRRVDYGESRYRTLGLLAGHVVVVIHTERFDLIRVISFRKATRHEAKAYLAEILF